MSSHDTKLLIAEAFVSLFEKTPLQKISVSDIVDASGINRKTFYYHFEDKNYLITWLFRYDLGQMLLQNFPKDQLIYESKGDLKSFSQFPYYIFKKSGVRSLDHSGFFAVFTQCLDNRRFYYSNILRDNSRTSLYAYLSNLYLGAIREDILFILSHRYLKESSIDFLSKFYSGAFLSFICSQIFLSSGEDILESVGAFTNIIHTSIETQIKEQQLGRIH